MKLITKISKPLRSNSQGAVLPVSYFTPMGLVTGSKSTGGENPLEVAFHNIALSLDTDEVKVIFTVHGDTVYFIGAAAKEFANVKSTEISSPLAYALPGISDPTSDVGIVTSTQSGGHAAIVRKGGVMTVYTGSMADAKKFAAGSDFESHFPPAEGTPAANQLPRWVGFNQSQTADTRRASVRFIGVLLVWSVLCSAAGLVGSVLGARNVEKLSNFRVKAEQAIQSAAMEMKSTGRKSETVLDEFQALSTMVVRAKGKVVKFDAADGRVIGWKIEVPDYTPSNGYEGFGIETAEKRDGKLYLSKGKEH